MTCHALARDSLIYAFSRLCRIAGLLSMHAEELGNDGANWVLVVSWHGRRIRAHFGKLPFNN